VISVLLPSRGRPASLAASIGSLLGKATSPAQVEVLVAADPDDTMTREVAETLGDEAHTDYGHDLVRLWVAPERFGYAQLHRYYNALAGMARGRWCLLWNDDATMLTDGWDVAIMSQDPAVLALSSNLPGGNFFPAWPAAWTAHLGHVSESPNVDVWISEVGRRVGMERLIPVQVHHDRADLTGGHQDTTYAEGRAVMGNYINHPGHDSPTGREARIRDAITLRQLLG
jgi:hypothetical protein